MSQFANIDHFVRRHEGHGDLTYRMNDAGAAAAVVVALDCSCGGGYVVTMPASEARSITWPAAVRPSAGTA